MSEHSWKYDRAILLGIYHAAWERPSRRSRHRAPGMRIDFASWLGRRPTGAERACMSRNLTSLQKRGLALRLPGRRVVLTCEGVKLAESMLDLELPGMCIDSLEELLGWPEERAEGLVL